MWTIISAAVGSRTVVFLLQVTEEPIPIHTRGAMAGRLRVLRAWHRELTPLPSRMPMAVQLPTPGQ